MKTRFILLWILFFITNQLDAQQFQNIAERLQEYKSYIPVTPFKLFNKLPNSKSLEYEEKLNALDFYKFNNSVISQFNKSQSELISININIDGQELKLELFEYKLYTDDFQLINASGEIINTDINAKYYHGIVDGQEGAIVSLSLINDDLKILISQKHGEIEISKYKDVYAAFDPNDQGRSKSFECAYANPHAELNIHQNHFKSKPIGGCIDIYLEADYEAYKDHDNSIANVQIWVEQLMNEVALVYDNEGIPIKISQLKIWDSPDPYRTKSSLSDILAEFGKNVKNDYNGRLAHLMSTRNISGGIAWLDVLCSSYNSNGHWGPYGVSAGLSTQLVPFPSYTWNVNCIAHEIGHNLGSRHTHECVWGTNKNQQIDDCGSHYTNLSPKPYCYDSFSPEIPNDGGTMMSYCQLSPVGVNMSKGFGAQPGDLIRYTFNNSFCVTGVDCSLMPLAPSIVCPANYLSDEYCKNENIDPALSGQATAQGGTGGLNISYQDVVANNDPCNYQITRNWLVTDALGQSDECIQYINASDNKKPQILNCPDDIFLSSTSNCQIQAYWPTIEISENCDGQAQIYSNYESGDYFMLGETVIELMVEDNCGNTSSCEFSVIVTDNILPTISNCPSDLRFVVDNSCTQTVSWSEPIANDNCGISSFVSSHQSGEVFKIGSTIVEYTAKDYSGNQRKCSFRVELIDLEKPSIYNCPNNISLQADQNCQAIANWSIPNAVDNCSVQSMHSNFSPGDYFPIGETEVTYTVFDEFGNHTSCSFTVTVIPNDLIEFVNCPTDIVLDSDYSCEAVATWIQPTVTGSCSNVSISSNYNSGSTFGLGFTQVQIIATDQDGNSSSCSFNVQVIDQCQSDLQIVCPQDHLNKTYCSGDQSNPSLSGEASYTGGFGVVNLFYQDEYLLDTDCHRRIERTWIATDEENNSSSCIQTIDYQNLDAPIISPLENGEYMCEDSIHFELPEVQENCSSFSLSFSDKILASPEGNIYTRTWTATDECGNQSFTSQSLFPSLDTYPKFISSLENVNYECGTEVPVTFPKVMGSCGEVKLEYEDLIINVNSCIGEGIIRTWIATDENGNSTTASHMIYKLDTTVPQFTNCPEDIAVMLDGNCQTPVSWVEPNAIDKCSTVQIESTRASGSLFPVGVHTIEHQAIDACGNTSICSFTVTVIDDLAPVFVSCPQNIEIISDDLCEAIAFWELPKVTDNCDYDVVANFNSGDSFGIGIHQVNYLATDDSGNSSSCSFEVKVIDRCTQELVIICPDEYHGDYNCDTKDYNTQVTGSASVMGSSGFTQLYYNDEVVSQDICGMEMKRKWIVKDLLINEEVSCVQLIYLNDNSAPIFNNCPKDLFLSVSESCDIKATWNTVLATDNCGLSVSIGSTHSSGNNFDLGEHEVMYTATDQCGNVAICTFIIKVEDDGSPIFNSCPTDIIVNSNSNCSQVVSWNEPTVLDQCAVEISSNYASGETFQVGSSMVIYTATDDAGNTSTCGFMIDVVDRCTNGFSMEAPSNYRSSLVCDPLIDSLLITGEPQFFNAVGEPRVSYKDSIVSDTRCHKKIARIWEAYDDDDGYLTGIQYLDLYDEKGPEFTYIPEDIALTINDDCLAVAEWNPAQAVDECGEEVSLTYSHFSGMDFQLGNTQVSVTATDACGNQSTSYFMVTVNYPPYPFFVACPPNQYIEVDDMSPVSVTWKEPVVYGICLESIDLESSHPQGSLFGMGITTIVYTATDHLGNKGYCYFSVEIIPSDQSECQDSIMISHDEVQSGTYASNLYLLSNATIEADSSVLYKAGLEIELSNGFEVEGGADFEIRIGDCKN